MPEQQGDVATDQVGTGLDRARQKQRGGSEHQRDVEDARSEKVPQADARPRGARSTRSWSWYRASWCPAPRRSGRSWRSTPRWPERSHSSVHKPVRAEDQRDDARRDDGQVEHHPPDRRASQTFEPLGIGERLPLAGWADQLDEVGSRHDGNTTPSIQRSQPSSRSSQSMAVAITTAGRSSRSVRRATWIGRRRR